MIINTSSVQAYEPSEILLDYAQTKAAIVALLNRWRTAGPERDPCQAVAPGPYWTVLQCCGGQPQEKVEKFGANAPLGRPGQPVEIAPLYVTLAARRTAIRLVRSGVLMGGPEPSNVYALCVESDF
ncbi:SDR family oxidoreductase [Klebsiella variicola]|uniref:SDR family oxidoreductase n=1 Tax=Klebsiella variicola TaxID=244366 RepID=UPI00396A4F0F